MIPERLFEQHTAALASFVSRARAVDGGRWRERPAEEKWSPAEVCEHVALSYELFLKEATSGVGMTVRTKFWQRLYLRLRFLPAILEKGAIPGGAPSPREARPSGTPGSREDILGRLVKASRRLEELLREDSTLRFTHPYFGVLSAEDGLRFVAIHTTHHEKQLPTA